MNTIAKVKSKTLASVLLALTLAACGQDQSASETELAATRVKPTAERSNTSSLTLAPLVQKVIKGPDAAEIAAILERSDVQRQDAIESSFFKMDKAFCKSGKITVCQFSIGSGLFVQSSFEDTQTMIGLLRKNRVSSQTIAQGRRWDLFNLECSTRFVLSKRMLESTCTFQQSELTK